MPGVDGQQVVRRLEDLIRVLLGLDRLDDVVELVAVRILPGKVPLLDHVVDGALVQHFLQQREAVLVDVVHAGLVLENQKGDLVEVQVLVRQVVLEFEKDAFEVQTHFLGVVEQEEERDLEEAVALDQVAVGPDELVVNRLQILLLELDEAGVQLVLVVEDRVADDVLQNLEDRPDHPDLVDVLLDEENEEIVHLPVKTTFGGFFIKKTSRNTRNRVFRVFFGELT